MVHRWIDEVIRDIRYVCRSLMKTPVFALTVVLTLAIGIGGNTAIFSVVDQLLLRPLPYPQGEQLLMVNESFGPRTRPSASPANWLDWKRDNRTIEDLAAWISTDVTLTGVGEPVRLSEQVV